MGSAIYDIAFFLLWGVPMHPYWKYVFGRIWSETLETLDLQTVGKVMIRVAIVVVSVVLLAFAGTENAAREEIIARIGAAVVVIGVFPAVFLWRLYKTPPQIDKERTEAIAQLQGVKGREALLDQVSELRVRMSKLRIAMQEDRDGIEGDHWKDQFTSLQKEIHDKIEEFAGSAEAILYQTRGNVARRFGHGLPPHQLYIDLAIYDLDHLRTFITDFSRGKNRREN